MEKIVLAVNLAVIDKYGTVHSRFQRMSFASSHLRETKQIIDRLDIEVIECMAGLLGKAHEDGGRLFFLGVGGSAGNCSHVVNDFRKIVGIEAYTPTDNMSELTARANDEGWETVFAEWLAEWLKGSRLRRQDVIFVFSVGGGNLEKNVSPNLVRALQYAKEVGATVLGIVGRDGGYTAKVGDRRMHYPNGQFGSRDPALRSHPSRGVASLCQPPAAQGASDEATAESG